MHIAFCDYTTEEELLFLETEKDHDFTYLPRNGETIDLIVNRQIITGVIEMVHWETIEGGLVAVRLYIRKIERRPTPRVADGADVSEKFDSVDGTPAADANR